MQCCNEIVLTLNFSVNSSRLKIIMIIIHISELLFNEKVMKTENHVTYCFHRYNMLPEDIKKKNIKIIHVSRDPRDVAVSYYHLSKMMTAVSYQGTWDAFFKDFTEGNIMFGSWFDYTQDWMKYKSDPNILCINYEGFLDDTTGTIKKIAEFIGCKLSCSIVDRISSIVSFSSMQKNPGLNRMNQTAFLDPAKGQFIRCGKIGDWKNYFTSEQEQTFGLIYKSFRSNSEVVFPYSEITLPQK